MHPHSITVVFYNKTGFVHISNVSDVRDEAPLDKSFKVEVESFKLSPGQVSDLRMSHHIAIEL